jgi:hypothetical protein
MGVLVWGEDTIKITFAQNGFWDRRGAGGLTLALTYSELREKLLAGDEEGVSSAFSGQSGSMTQLPGGRLTLDFDEAPKSAELDLATGILVVSLASGRRVQILHDMDLDLLHVEWDRDSGVEPKIQLDASSEINPKVFLEKGLMPAEREGPFQFRQSTPADDSFFALVTLGASSLQLASFVGSSGEGLTSRTWLESFSQSTSDWGEFWQRIPDLSPEDAKVEETLRYCLWKLHILNHPKGVACTLQGAWMEDHRPPLWSNDYHFNINLQMIIQPCLDLELWDHLTPVWNLILSRWNVLERLGEAFFERKGALMLPHATDDRFMPIGSFWHGTVDHVSTTWMAILTWRAAKGSGDESLRNGLALPLMKGAFEGWWAMLEPDGDGLQLPLTVSPEYGEGGSGTWGKNSSFSLAAVHCLVESLVEASPEQDQRWQEVASKLPKATLIRCPDHPYADRTKPRYRIGLWEGQDLDHSHRHHSHLAGIYPFGVLGDFDQKVMQQTLQHWAYKGGGEWSAWGVCWAICIMARAGWKKGAESWLRFLLDSTLNEGKSLSAGGCRGAYISWGSAEIARLVSHEGDHEVMQLDANMGFISAFFETKNCRERKDW